MEEHAIAGDAQKFTDTLVALIGTGLTRDLLLKSLAFLDKEDVEKREKVEEQREEDTETEQRVVLLSSRSVQTSGGIDFEVLERVFRYIDFPGLCKVAQVCIAWRDLALDPSFWPFAAISQSRIALPCAGGAPDTRSEALRAVLRLPRFSQLHSIELTQWKDFMVDEWLVTSLAHLPALRHLSLQDCSGVTFENPDLANFRNLTSLNLGTIAIGQNVTNTSLSVIGQLTNLRKIDLHYCDKINDYGIHHLAALPKLQLLDLGDCYKLTSSTLSTIVPLSSSLTWLSLKSPRRSNTFIKDNGLENLALFTRLTHLDLGWCKRITDAGMLHIGKLVNLTYLGLAATPITDTGLHALRKLKNIRVIDTTFCYELTTEAAVMVTNNYPFLKAINFRGVPLGKYNSLSLMRLGECKCLEEIDFTNTYIDDTIMAPQYCKQGAFVHKINLSYNSSISDETVSNVCTYCPCLSNLIVSHCSKLTNKSLEHLQKAKHLKQVDITGIYSLSTSAISQVASVLPHLKIIKNDELYNE